MPRKAKKLYEYIDRAAISRLAGEPLLSSNPMEGSVSGHHRSNHKGSSVEFAEYREYTPGEDRAEWTGGYLAEPIVTFSRNSKQKPTYVVIASWMRADPWDSANRKTSWNLAKG